MSLKKQFLKSKPVCKVTFELPKAATEQAKKVTLVGEFNNWSNTATPLSKKKTGDYKVVVDLEIGRDYQFRYLVDGKTWENDWEADAYVKTDIPGTENSVVKV